MTISDGSGLDHGAGHAVPRRRASTRRRSGPSSNWQIEKARTASCRSARPARARRSAMTSTSGSSRSASRRRAGACRSSPAPARTTPPRRSTFATPRREGRRRRAPRRHALLQQADPGGPLPALQGDQRRGRHPDHHLQHPAALGDRHVGRDDGAALRAARTSSASRTRPPTSRRVSRCSARRWGRTSSSSRARTRPRSASWRMAATAASRSPSNVAPRLCAELQEACLRRRLSPARSTSRTG